MINLEIMSLINIVKNVNSYLWGPPMMILLVGFGLLSTIYLGFPQIRKLKFGFKETFGKIFNKDVNEKGSMSSFQALSTAIAAQVGTGNIGGVATAIVSGGPGAIFWMWITAIFGMATIYVEAILAQKYNEVKDGEQIGGPAYYISKGLANKNLKSAGKILAAIFAVLIIIALGFVGNMVQSNSISSSISSAFGVNPLVIGVILAIIASFIFIGGQNRIARFAETVVPFMAAIYILGTIVVFVKFNDRILDIIKLIFNSAFSIEAVAGGVAGITVKQVIRYGVARGLFSNEAGMGSTPNSHAAAKVAHPGIQGSVAMVGVFVDTILVCTATAFVVLVTGADKSGKEGAMITMEGFKIAFGDTGAKFLAIALLFFAFTTIIGWYYFGLTNIKYLFKSKFVILIYQIIVIAFIILGSVQKVDLVWELTDMFNGLMVIPNVIGLLFLIKEAKNLSDDFYEKY